MILMINGLYFSFILDLGLVLCCLEYNVRNSFIVRIMVFDLVLVSFGFIFGF